MVPIPSMISVAPYDRSSMSVATRSALAAVLVGLCCLACETTTAPPAPEAVTGKLQDLYSRPLKLPVLAPGAKCPESPPQTIGLGRLTKENDIPSSGQGTWPFFISGSDGTGWLAGQGALLLISPEYVAPLIVRGHQLDGSGGMPLVPASSANSVEIASTTSTNWRQWDGQIAQGTAPGCYGLQADGFNFTSQIVIAVVPGTPGPA